jgi:hypothetical protein
MCVLLSRLLLGPPGYDTAYAETNNQGKEEKSIAFLFIPMGQLLFSDCLAYAPAEPCNSKASDYNSPHGDENKIHAERVERPG